MGSTTEQLQGLFSASQLAALGKVREKLLKNPEALDTHKKKEKVS